MFEFLTSQTGPLDYEHIFLSPNIILSVVRMAMLVHSNQIQIQTVSLTHLVRERLLENRQEKFLSMKMDDKDIFGKDSLDFGKLGLFGHAINTSDCKPVKQPPCRVPQTNSERLSINSLKSY